MQKNAVVLLPSYQPEDTLVVLSKALVDLGYKVVVVDDGSGEQYKAIFDQVKSYVDLISYVPNKGKGHALKTGFKYILENYPNYECVITADGDGQHRIMDINRVYEKAISTHKTVIGERHFDVKVPLRSKIGNSLSKFTQALTTYRYMKDNQCGLRAFPISLLDRLLKIKGNRYEYEMRVLTHLQMKEIPYLTLSVQTIYEDGNKTSHFRPIRDTILIQSSILVCGLINLLMFALNVIGAALLCKFVFNEQLLSYELSVIVASFGTFLLHVLTNIIIFRPRYFLKAIVRLILYELLILISCILSVTLFCRICNFEIYAAYLVCYPLIWVPLYYLIKGVGLVYSAQQE